VGTGAGTPPLEQIMDWKNKLFFGDNLKILREHVPDASVDLINLDPPFNSSATSDVVAPTFRSALARLKPGATHQSL
jgi:predicted methyltransferase